MSLLIIKIEFFSYEACYKLISVNSISIISVGFFEIGKQDNEKVRDKLLDQ